MPTTVKTGWLKDKNGDKFAPKTLVSQVQTNDGILLEDKISDIENAASRAAYINIEDNENVEVPEGGGTSIDVTAEVGQTVIVKEVDADGKPTAWESADYQPRTHYEIDNVPYIPETTVTEWEDGAAALTSNASIIEGETYTVNYNGTAYESVCINVDGMLWLGNYDAMTGEGDTGEPYVMAIIGNENEVFIYMLIPLDGSASVTISVVGKEVVKIPDKYLSDATKPVYVKVVNDEVTIAPEYLLNQYRRGRLVYAQYWWMDDGTQAILPMTIIHDEDNTGSCVFSALINGAKIITIELTATDDGAYTTSVEIKELT